MRYHELNLEMRKAPKSFFHQHSAFLHQHLVLFDQTRENKLLTSKINSNQKKRNIWKFDRIIFPVRYPGPNLDTGKASKCGLQKGTLLFLLVIWLSFWRCAYVQQALEAPKLNQILPIFQKILVTPSCRQLPSSYFLLAVLNIIFIMFLFLSKIDIFPSGKPQFHPLILNFLLINPKIPS